VTKISLASDCHNAKTAQTGAGFGKGLLNKDGKNYWVNDISSHVYDVPRKDNKGVKGVEPGKAMPIPYTNQVRRGLPRHEEPVTRPCIKPKPPACPAAFFW
jgi:hypothetical protein